MSVSSIRSGLPGPASQSIGHPHARSSQVSSVAVRSIGTSSQKEVQDSRLDALRARVVLLSQKLKKEVTADGREVVFSQLMEQFIRLSDFEIVQMKQEFSDANILTKEKLSVRKVVSNAIKTGSYSELRACVKALLGVEGFAVCLAISRVLPFGSDRDQILSLICVSLAQSQRLQESLTLIQSISDKEIGSDTVCLIAENLIEDDQKTALALLDILPEKFKSKGLAQVANHLKEQGRHQDAVDLAEGIPLQDVKNEVLLNLFDSQHGTYRMIKKGLFGLADCCATMQHLFNKCCGGK